MLTNTTITITQATTPTFKYKKANNYEKYNSRKLITTTSLPCSESKCRGFFFPISVRLEYKQQFYQIWYPSLAI